jgi:hypothetical protein
MNETDSATGIGRDAEPERSDESSGRAFVSKRTQSLRTAFESGALAGFSGGVGLLWGLLTLARGDRERGIARLLTGGSLVAIATAQRQSSDGRETELITVDQTDVVGGTADIEDVASRGETDEGGHASGGEAQDVVGSSADIENAGPAPEVDSDVEGTNVDQSDVAGSGIDEESLDDVAEDEGDLEDTALDEESLEDAAVDERDLEDAVDDVKVDESADESEE